MELMLSVGILGESFYQILTVCSAALCQLLQCLSKVHKTTGEDVKQHNSKGTRKQTWHNVCACVCTLQLRSYSLLVSLASFCWRCRSVSCLPFRIENTKRCDCGCSCLYLISPARDKTQQSSECFWNSLSSVFSCSTSLRRSLSSSLWSFELKLRKHRKEKGCDTTTKAHVLLLIKSRKHFLSWTHYQLSEQLWKQPTCLPVCPWTWPAWCVLFSFPPFVFPSAPHGDSEPPLEEKKLPGKSCEVFPL